MYQTLYTGNGVDIFVNGPTLQWRLEWVPVLAAKLKSVFEPATPNGHATLSAPPAPVVQERIVFLPPGDWNRPVLHPGAGSNGGPPAKPDSGRLTFMRSQPYAEQHVGLPAFGHGRRYDMFVFRKANGQLVIVVEADMTNNAALVLRWHKAWRKTIQLTKGRLYGPRRSRRHPMIMAVIRHVGDWQDQVRRLIS